MIDREINANKIRIGQTILFVYKGVEVPAKVTGIGDGRVDIVLPAAPEPIPWSLRVRDISGIVS